MGAIDLSGVDLLALIESDVRLRQVARTGGGEWHGPCPFCGGVDRFCVWPNSDPARYWCRECDAGGDAISYVRARRGLTFPDALAELRINRPVGERAAPAPAAPAPLCVPPSDVWQAGAAAVVWEAMRALWRPEGATTKAYLTGQRRLTVGTLHAAGIGCNPADRHIPAAAFGLDREEPVYLPRGIVIPWFGEDGETIWRVQIRRPLSRAQQLAGVPKVLQVPGGANGLYHVEALQAARPAMVLEGELNVLTVQQEAGGLVAPVGTGATSWARDLRWLMRLGGCCTTLISFDGDDDPAKGDRAAAWWTGALGATATRWRPWANDPNGMLQAGGNVRAWVQAGLDAAQLHQASVHAAD